jgi:hypothetical protein
MCLSSAVAMGPSTKWYVNDNVHKCPSHCTLQTACHGCMLQHGTVAKAQLETALHGATGRLCVSDACGRQCDSGCADPLQQTNGYQRHSSVRYCAKHSAVGSLTAVYRRSLARSGERLPEAARLAGYSRGSADCDHSVRYAGTTALLRFASLRFASLPKGSTAQRRNDVLLQALPMESARHSARATRRVRL